MKPLQNKKVTLGIAALICLIGIIALCSFFPFIIDPSRWQTEEFLSDELIIVAIVIFATICLMLIAQASNAMNPKSKIAQSRVRFASSVSKIIEGKRINAFGQWVKKVLQPCDIRSAKERRLVKAGIDDMSVLDLTDSEIKALVGAPQKYGDKFYKSIDKKQCKEVLDAKKARFSLVDPSYYLTCEKGVSDRTITEQSAHEGKKKSTLLTWSILSKIVVTIIIAMIFTSLVYDNASSIGAAKGWMKFMSRMMSLASSSFMGYIIGCQMNDIDASYIELKISAHERYFEDSSFQPKTQQEEAKEEFVERVKEENSMVLLCQSKRKGGGAE